MLRSLVRLLRRSTSFSFVTITTLGLGLAATVTIFTVVNGILFESLPYPDADELISVNHQAPGLDLQQMGVSAKLYLHYAENASTLDEVALRSPSSVTLTGAERPERVQGWVVTPSYFRVLQTPALMGRTFTEQEGLPGGPRVVVLSHALWQRRFGADPDLVGKTIPVDSEDHEVIGIMPPGFETPDREILQPMVIDPASAQLGAFQSFGLARRSRDRSLEEVRTELGRLSSDLEQSFPEDSAAPILDRSGFGATVVPLLESLVGGLQRTLWLLLGTVAGILAIACANVANLHLIRVEERTHELGLRSALGATRGRLIRDVVAESVGLALLAGSLGTLLAVLAVELFQRFGPASVPRLQSIGVNGRVLVFSLLISLAAGLLFGLLPALRAGTTRLLAAVRQGTRSATGRLGQRTRNVLVMGQVALSLILLVGCALLARSLFELRSADLGFDESQRVTFRISLPRRDYPDAGSILAFTEKALEGIRALPGVDSAGLATILPTVGRSSGAGYAIEDVPIDGESLPPVFAETHVSEGYLETLDARLVEGRFLSASDAVQRTGNLLISRSLKERFWPDESALGKRIYPGRSRAEDGWYTVVGVVENLELPAPGQPLTDHVYKPLLGLPDAGHDAQGGLTFVVETSLPSRGMIGPLRAQIWNLDDDLPIAQMQTLEEYVAASRAQAGFTVVLLTISSGLALLLAAIGLYGVVSYVAARRTHEMGIRAALGANQASIARLVLTGGMAVGAAGIGLGVAISIALSRFLGSFLFEISTLDPATFVLVPAVLLLVTLIASWIPARRAAAVDPQVALRTD